MQRKTPSVRSVHQEAVKERNSAKLFRRKLEIAHARQKSLLEAWDGKRRRQIEILPEQGSSSWLTALPLKEHGFWLKKQDFRDVLALRYDWQLHNIPSTCICGTDFSPDHAMTCSFGGFPTIRHNELRDFIGSVVCEVCHDVENEPLLQPLGGEVFQARSTTTSQEARADVRAIGFWTRWEAAFFDVRVFHAGASSYRDKSFSDFCQLHQRAKQLEYEERIISVDHGSFCPLVFATSGATGPLCDWFLKHLAGKVADRDPSEYSCVIAWLRCRISFALLSSAVMCIRGSRSSRRSPVNNANRELSLARPSFLEEGWVSFLCSCFLLFIEQVAAGRRSSVLSLFVYHLNHYFCYYWWCQSSKFQFMYCGPCMVCLCSIQTSLPWSNLFSIYFCLQFVSLSPFV